MVDPAQAPNPASVASNPNPAPSQNNPNVSQDAQTKQGLASDPSTLKAAQEPVTTGANKNVARSSTLISNPVNRDETVPEVDPAKQGLPQGTLDEMAAGKKALERNRPVAQAMEDARAQPETPKA